MLVVGKLGCHGSKWWGLKKATIASQQNGIYIVAKYVVETTCWLETWKPTQKTYFGRSKKFQTWPIHRVHANMYSHKRSLYVPSKKKKFICKLAFEKFIRKWQIKGSCALKENEWTRTRRKTGKTGEISMSTVGKKTLRPFRRAPASASLERNTLNQLNFKISTNSREDHERINSQFIL